MNVILDLNDTLVEQRNSEFILMPKTLTLLNELKKKNASIALWTAGSQRYAKEILTNLNILEFFDCFQFGNQQMKPTPTQELIDFNADVMIGDTGTDRICAQNLGAKFYHIDQLDDFFDFLSFE
jgi:phosphoglycolate phosphatase-like HAD superfamily hydrolase